mgnify:CR=1 FL=1
MLVVFGKENADMLKDKITILELDTFVQEGLPAPVTAYAVIQMEDVPLQDISTLANMVKLHNNMWPEYRKKNFSYCEQAMEHLVGKWKGSLDSFYSEFENRIKNTDVSKLPENWDGMIYKGAPEEI